MSNTIEVIYQPVGNNLQCTAVICGVNTYNLQDQNQVLEALSCLNGQGLNDVTCGMNIATGMGSSVSGQGVQLSTSNNFSPATGSQSGGDITVVLYSTSWCGPCKAFAPKWEQLQSEFSGRVNFVKKNADVEPSPSGSVPYLTINGNQETVDYNSVRSKLNALLQDQGGTGTQTMRQRLGQRVGRNKGQGQGPGQSQGLDQNQGQGQGPGQGQGQGPGQGQGQGQCGPGGCRPGQGSGPGKGMTTGPTQGSNPQTNHSGDPNFMKGAIHAGSVEEAKQKIADEHGKGKHVILVSTASDCGWCNGLKKQDISNFNSDYGDSHSVVHLHASQMRDHPNKGSIAANDSSWPSVTSYPHNGSPIRHDMLSLPSHRNSSNQISPAVLHHIAKKNPPISRPKKGGRNVLPTRKKKFNKKNTRKNKLQYTLQQKYIETPTM